MSESFKKKLASTKSYWITKLEVVKSGMLRKN